MSSSRGAGVFDRPSRRPAAGDVPAVARRQAGVFSAAQARAEGWSDRQIRRRVEFGRWVRVAGRGIAAADASQDGWSAMQLSYAAVLTIPDAVISHATAGSLHGWPLPAERFAHVISRTTHRSPAGIRVHSPIIPPRSVCALRPGLRVTTLARTALDLLCSLSAPAGLDLWAYLSSRKLVALDDLHEVIKLKTGRPGVHALRVIAESVRSGAVSGAELLLHQALQAAGITGWAAGVAVVDQRGIIGVVDVLFADAMLVIEVDGWRAHKGRPAFVNDRRRQNRLVAARYTVLRFTWDDLERNPADAVRQIRRELDRAA